MKVTPFSAFIVFALGCVIIDLCSPNPITTLAACLTWMAALCICYTGHRLRNVHRDVKQFEEHIGVPPGVIIENIIRTYRAALREHFITMPCDCTTHPAPWGHKTIIHEPSCVTFWGKFAAAMLEGPPVLRTPAVSTPAPADGTEPELDYARRACEQKSYPQEDTFQGIASRIASMKFSDSRSFYEGAEEYAKRHGMTTEEAIRLLKPICDARER